MVVGLSIETDSYLSDQKVDVGDEGFYTTASLLGGADALVRKGGALVYVSVQPTIASTGTGPDLDLENGGFASDNSNCTTAQQVADRILG